MTKKEKKLIAVIGLVVILLTACASKAANATEKIELGQKYLTEANYTEAIAAFTEVIKIDPSNIEAYMGRAEAYKGLRRPLPRAITAWQSTCWMKMILE